MRWFAVWLALLGAGVPALAQQTSVALSVGTPAPELSLAEVVRGPSEVSLATLKGRVVVLEFWASWCAPCVAVMTHIEELANEMAGEGVVFIAISDEERAKIQKHASGHPSSVWVRDAAGATARAYGARTLPHTVVIGADGVVIAVTTPEQVSADALRRAVRGEAIDLPGKVARESDLEWDLKAPFNPSGQEPLTNAVIEPTSCDGAGSIRPPGGRSFTADGMTIVGLLTEAYGVSPWRMEIDLPRTALEQQYRASIWVAPGDEEALTEVMRAAVATFTDVEATWVRHERDVLVLVQRAGGHRMTPTSGAGELRFMRGKIEGVAAPIERLRTALENFAGKPVIDGTALGGTYSFELEYSPGDPSVLRGQLAERLGLEMRPAKRELNVLVVRLRDHGR